MFSHKLKKILIIIFTSLIVATCSTGINLFSDNDEVQFGKQVDDEIRNNPNEYPIYNKNPQLKKYITERIFNHILESPAIAKRNVYNYQLEIINQDSILNAFATPGGYVYLYTGLIKYLDSEAALAGVIGHEIAHAERRHATQRITATYGLSILLNIALGNNPSQVAEIVGNLFAGLTLLANSRANEDESDEFSITYLKTTRYYPGSVKFFFEQLRDDNKVGSEGSGIGTFLSTHPDPIDRINTTNQRLQTLGMAIKDYKSNDSDIYKKEYQTNSLAKLK